MVYVITADDRLNDSQEKEGRMLLDELLFGEYRNCFVKEKLTEKYGNK